MNESIVFYNAANGEKSARLGVNNLFSRYNPRQEAERYAASVLKNKSPSLVIVLGAGLGYLEGAAAKMLPHAVIRAVYYSAVLAPEKTAPGRTGAGQEGACWHPARPTNLLNFLKSAVGEGEAGEVEVIEWPPAARAFPEISREARNTLLRLLKENAYGALTVASSGRRWLRNTLANFLRLDNPLAGNPLDAERTTVIAAAGPSLVRSLPLLEAARDRIDLCALASSLPALASRGLAPDLVVATDPGHYASRLLHSVRGKIPLLAMPLSGARGAWAAAERVLLFAQPNFFEQEMFRRGGLAPPAVDAHGTVAGTALFLARFFGSRRIVFAGLDFGYDDILSHARPHEFFELAAGAASRLSPQYSQICRRALEEAPARRPGTRWRAPESHLLYAASFQGSAAGFRLFPSPSGVPGLAEMDEAGWARIMGSGRGPKKKARRLFPWPNYPDAEKRKRVSARLLDDWLDLAQGALGGSKGGAWPASLFALLRFFSGHPFRTAERDLRLLKVETGNADVVPLLKDLTVFLSGLREKYL